MTKGTRPGRLPQPSKEADHDRVCSHPGCETRLSIYNSDDRCWQHVDAAIPNHRGRRMRDERA